MEQELTLTISDWLMIIAVLLAPLLAVQAQKQLEKLRESRGRKMRNISLEGSTRKGHSSK